ncbi:TPA: 4-deoxy-L-threo-5-hexosulose-uronate ketol-isomerase, partial [Streptococcus suis]
EATELVHLHQLTTRSFLEILPNFNEYLLTKILRRKTFVDYIYQNGTNKLLLEKLTAYKV